MDAWTVEIDDDLLRELDQWSEERQLEALAIQQRLERGGPEALGLIDATASDRSGMPGEAEYVAMYCQRSGRSSIPEWNLYLAFSMFRLACILLGVYARVLQGNAASSHALQPVAHP